MRLILLAGCLLDLALVRAEAADRVQGAAAADTGQRPGLIAEVVVTAQKRVEALQDVPIAISVIGGPELDKSTARGMLELLNRTPGVAMYGTDRPLLSIRGVTAGSVTASAGSNPVSYYLDTLPFSLARTAIVPDVETYDLQRVEVLRGPQGTLYGANATVGVVRVLTNKADPDAFELKGRTALSSTQDGGDNLRGDAAINVPVVPGKLAVRGVVGYQDLSGWIDKPNRKDVNDAEIRTGRLRVDAQPTEEFSIGLSGWTSRSDYGAPPNSDDDRRHASLIDEPLTDDYDVYGLTLGYEFSGFSISTMSGYLDYEHTDVRDHRPTLLGTVPVPRLATTLSAHTFSQEIVATASPDSVWQWTLGGMYRDSTDRLRQNSLAGGIPFDFSQGSESYAVFGEIGRRFFGERFGWIIGLRSFHDDAFINENVNQGPPGSSPIHATAESEATTPRVVLTWYPSADLTLYTSYAEGFRSGFPQNPSVRRTLPTFPPLKPDELHNYELGLKAILFDGRLSLDGAAFYIDWRDTQQSLSIFNGTVPVAAQVNSKSASGPGFEFALTARPSDSFEVSATFGWNDLTFDEDVLSRGIVLFPKGGRLNGSPEYTAGLSADYRFPLGGGFEGRLGASGNYISSRADKFLLGTTVLSTEGDDMLIARASFAVDYRDRWTATVFVDNANDESGSSIQSVLSQYWASHVRPRTFGLQFEFSFR
jgi:iron complex outermembrane recepter protein